jgi:hypothetical protein
MKIKYPNKRNEIIQKLTRRELVFNDVASAMHGLKSEDLTNFTRFNEYNIDPNDANSFIIWVYGFALSSHEIRQGYVGSFCKIYISEFEAKFILTIEKVHTEKENHPIQEPPSESNQPKYIDSQRITDFTVTEYETYENILYSMYCIIKSFTIDKETNLDKDNVVIWVRGYKISSEENKQGAIGNFVQVSIVKNEHNHFKIEIDKIYRDAKYHPQRQNKTHRLPNSGDPVIKRIKNQSEHKIGYNIFDEPLTMLNDLRKNYPNACVFIPPKTLLVHIFSKKEGERAKILEHSISIDEIDGKYYFTFSDRLKKTRTPDFGKYEDNYFSTFYKDFLEI